MKRMIVLVLVVGAGFLAGGMLLSKRSADRHASQLAAQKAVWDLEKANLEAALEDARRQARLLSFPSTPPPTPEPAPVELASYSPEEIIANLVGLAEGARSSYSLRRAVYWLEELADLGPAALPAIAEFLARYEDVELETSLFQGRVRRDRLPMEFILPPSLRFGLFDVVRRVGGADAERILGEALARTGRGVEVAYLASLLEEMAPGKYRERALGVARTLLTAGAPVDSASPLDRNHRDYLYSVLTRFGDTMFAREAHAQLVGADSQVDRSALNYLQQVLGPQAVPVVAQAYRNPALTNSTGREPLARLALNFVGADAQANQFYEVAINDPVLTRSHRKNLIEDLNQDGFADTRNLTPTDLPLIENRMTLIEQLVPNAMDDANLAAFKEAYKDLVNMRAKVTGTQPGSVAIPGIP